MSELHNSWTAELAFPSQKPKKAAHRIRKKKAEMRPRIAPRKKLRGATFVIN
jgi:hypothetical protein